jgi:hypothetical protein
MMKRCGILLVLIALSWTGTESSLVQAAGDVFERTSLKGLKSVQVVIEELAPDIAKDGLNRDQIKSSVERQLEQAGILVEQQAENAFYVHLGSAKNETGVYSYALSLQLVQLVFLFRDPSLLTWGTTWSLNLIGSVTPENLSEMEPLISRGVNAFVTDYHIANDIPG